MKVLEATNEIQAAISKIHEAMRRVDARCRELTQERDAITDAFCEVLSCLGPAELSAIAIGLADRLDRVGTNRSSSGARSVAEAIRRAVSGEDQ